MGGWMWSGICGEAEEPGSRLCFHATGSRDVYRQMSRLAEHCSRF